MWVSAIDLAMDIVLFATTDWSSYNKRQKKTDHVSSTCHVDNNNLLVAAKKYFMEQVDVVSSSRQG